MNGRASQADMRTAPRDGRLIWLFSKDEWSGPRAGYWFRSSGASWWRALTGEWINGATSWSDSPLPSPTPEG